MAVVRVRHSPGGVDQYGDPVAGTSTDVELAGAFVAPRESVELTERGRAGVIVGLTVYAPFGTDLLASDQARVNGVLYDVDGEVGSWESGLTGWGAGITAALRRAVG